MNSPPRILVAHSYFLRYDPKQWARMEPYPPLGTLMVAATLRQHSHDVHLFDAMLARGVEAFTATLTTVNPDYVVIVEDNFNYLTKMCTTRMRDAAFAMIRASKDAGCRVAVNGSDATDRATEYLRVGADAIIIGEPEETVTELVSAWNDTTSTELTRIRGLALPLPVDAELPTAFHTPLRPAVENLDALPLPAWDLIDVNSYREAWKTAHSRFSWNLVASRGCPYKCNWCAKPIFGTRYAQRSPESLAGEVAHVLERYQPEHVWYADDIFGLTGDWIEAFSREVAQRDARVPFMMQSRANLMKPRVVDALAAAGAEEVWLGAESGSQRILDAMDKGTTVLQVREATRRLRRAGIRVGYFIQLGYPGEEWDDLLKTRDLIREEQPDDVGVSVSYPLPGTKFFENVKRDLGSKTNWRDSAELAMMFQGTYTTSFYRRVRNILHEELTLDDKIALERKWRELEHARHDVNAARAGQAH